MSDRYTHGHHETVLRSHRWRTVANSATYLLEHLEPGLSLLDVGCGPGTLTDDLARHLAPGRVVGLDRSADVLVEAAASSSSPNIDYVAGDVYDLAFPDASFDIVHAHQVLQHLTDPVRALKEMARVCRPDGVVAVRDADYRAMTWWPLEPALDDWMDLYQAVARANRAEPDAGRRLFNWAQEANLTDITATASVWTYADPITRDWWGGMWAERILESDFALQALDQRLASRAHLEEISSGWRRWASARDGWFVIVHGEVIGRPG